MTQLISELYIRVILGVWLYEKRGTNFYQASDMIVRGEEYHFG